MLTSEQLMPRVETGAVLLDAGHSGWFDRIDLQRLNLRSGCDCVLAQLGVFYSVELANLTPYCSMEERLAFAVTHGFTCEGDDEDEEWAALKECWTTAILERRFAAQSAQEACVEVTAC